MNLLAGTIFAVAGLVIAILGFLKVVPGLSQPGIFIILIGGVMIGLSFIKKPDPEGTERISTPTTLINIFFSPTEAFQNLRRHPRWLVATLVLSLFAAVFSNLFVYRLTAERVANYAIDKTLEMPIMNDQARRQIEAGRQEAIDQAKNPVIKTVQTVSSFGVNVVKFGVYAAFFLVFVLAMGGKINYWQAFSVAAYASVPPVLIHSVLSSVVLFLKDPVLIHPILGQTQLLQDNLGFLFNPAESPALYSFASHISILWFYWIWLVATGLKNAGEKVTGSIAWTIALTLFALLLFFGVVISYLFSGFLS